MAVNISYMGTKRELAPAVADVIRRAQPGIMLDAFAGMCSVGEEVAPSRQVWSNDVQVFAAEVGRALFTSTDEPISAIRAADLHFDVFQDRRRRLAQQYTSSLLAESRVLDSSDFNMFSKRKAALSKTLAREITQVRPERSNVFTRLYSDSYFGLSQANEIDAILGAIGSVHAVHRISDDQRRWLRIALGRALLKTANSTGHFAQYLKPKSTSYKRYVRQRRRSLWAEWLFSVGELSAVGTSDWRRRNRSFNQDSLVLLPALKKIPARPSVIYADPPYTNDQYSRYYHILETMMLSDKPTVSGTGLYRPGRFQTPFSIKSKCVQAFDHLVSAAATTGADLVLSYPSNGLVHELGVDPQQILRRHFRTVECCCSVPFTHSTFGASKGVVRSPVTELIYWAKT